jgi:ADP-heptose:LPS heptosyltransferase
VTTDDPVRRLAHRIVRSASFMNTSTLRAIDRLVGLPACRLLTIHRRIVGDPSGGATGRILFVKLAEQGSTVLADRAISAAIDRVGRDNVFFLAFEENRFVLDVMGLLPPANVLTIDANSIATVARTTLGVLKRLRQLRIDVAVDLEFFARSSAIFSYLSGASRRVGLHSFAGEGPARGDLMTHRLAYNPYLHTSDLFLLLVNTIDIEPARLPAVPVPADALGAQGSSDARFVPRDDDLAEMRRLVLDLTGRPDVPPLILLNANCGDMLPLRKWDGMQYVELARRLLDAHPDRYVAFTGNPAEADEANRLAAAVASRRCVSVAGRTTLPQLLALFSIARVLVTNDSGPAHFATLTPIHVVTLFGPETPALFAARSPRNHVLWAGLACSPCVSAFNNRLSTCRDNLCMQRISVDEVVAACERAMSRKSVPNDERSAKR